MSKLTHKDKEKLLKVTDKEYEFKNKIINWIIRKQQIITIGELSRRLDRSKESVVRLLSDLVDGGYDIKLDTTTKEVEEIKSPEFKKQLVRPRYKRCMKIGCVSDTHMGSVYQQLSLLHDAYKIMEEEDVDYCIHAGDLSDGPKRMHMRTPEEIFLNDTDEFISYIVKNYPKTDKFKTYILDSGSHDTYWKRFHGVNLVRKVCEQRSDLILRRGNNAQFVLEGTENVVLRMIHAVGSSSYARSYKPQKQLEGIMGEFLEQLRRYESIDNVPNDNALPHVFVMGHYHLYNHMEHGGVEAFMLPSFQSISSYLRDRGLYPNIGFIILRLYFDQNKVISKVNFTPYRFNAYTKKNDY